MDVKETIEYVKANMIGRIADEEENTSLMASMTLRHGNHLEIGTLHGGVAIVVALLKKQNNFSGDVYCIDPLDGYYTGTRWACDVDPESGVPVSAKTIKDNAARFCVNLNITQKQSVPFPLFGGVFSTTYIDGNHWGDFPLIDFINASMVTSDFIIFDNCDEKHPDVMRACDIAEKTWMPHFRKGITCVVKHPCFEGTLQ